VSEPKILHCYIIRRNGRVKKFLVNVKNGRLGFISLVCFFLLTTQISSAAEKEGEESVKLDEITVTATRSAKLADEIFADVEIISSEDIANSSANNFTDLLRGIPGLDNRGETGPGGWFSTNIRGIESSKGLLIMMDGVPLNSGLGEWNYTTGIDLSTVDQIDVVKGCFSSLYGSNAMGGVINVISKKKKTDGFSTTPKFYAGNFGYEEYGANLIGRNGKFSFSLNASQQNMDNRYRRDKQLEYVRSGGMGGPTTYTKVYNDIVDADSENLKLFTRFDYDVDGTTGITFTGKYDTLSENIGKTKYLPTVRELGTKDKDYYFLNLNGRTRISDLFDLDMRIYTNHHLRDTNKEQIVSRGMGGTVYGFGHQDFSGRNSGIQIKTNVSLGDNHFFTAGVDSSFKEGYWKETYEDGTVIDKILDKSMDSHALYLQDEIDISSLTITIGGRYDTNSESESAFSPKLGLFYKFNDRISFRGSAGKAFRAPSLQELYQPTWLMGMYLFYSNPDLKPETLWSYDIGTTIKITPEIEFSLTGFYSKAKDMISTRKAEIEGRTVRIFDNIDEVENDGFEAGISGDITDWLNLYLNYTYTHSIEKDVGRRPDVPLHQANIGIGTKNDIGSNIRLYTTLNARYSGETTYVDNMTKQTVESLDGFTVFDFIVRLNLWKKLNLKCAVYNITDEEFQVHGSNLGPTRYFWAGGELTF
jgi:outer membrane receptor protein involved in Fe transport